MGKGFGSVSQPIHLSLCMIVKNESHRLSDCLASVKDFVDEIIVTDTGSSDRTVEIAKQHKAKVSRFAWCDDFATARNYALSQAKGEWILVLDADELLEASIQPLLTEVMQQPNCLAVNLVRLEVGANQSPYSLVSRLFRRRPDLNFTGIYHERIDDQVEAIIAVEPHWQVVTVPNVAMRHYGYEANQIADKQKYDFAKRLMHKHLEAFPHDRYMHSKLGALYISENSSESEQNFERGIELLQNGLNLTVENSDRDQILFELHYHLGLAYTQRSQIELALQAYQTALDLDVPDLVKLPAYINLGSLWLEQKEFTRAIAAYEQAIAIAPQFAKGFANLGIALKAIGRFGEAISAYEQAIRLEPTYAEAYQNLGVVQMRLGQVQSAIDNFKQAIYHHEQQQNFTSAEGLRSGLQDMGLL
jgi:tetratricopeptide (TPR) repeat protein